MNVTEVHPTDFMRLVGNQDFFFLSPKFNELNKYKCQQLLYLIQSKGNKAKLAMVGGIVNGTFKSPFSAPYGGVINIGNKARLEYIYEWPSLLEGYLRSKDVKKIEITLPPLFYNETFLSELVNAFYHQHYKISAIDLNYHFNLSDFNDRYITNIKHSARKNLNISLRQNFKFIKCNSIEGKKKAYDIIKQNRTEKNYSLAMSFQELNDTIDIVNHDFFIVVTNEENPIAASINFRACSKISQVIYWGCLSKFNNLKPMNFLSYHIVKFYKEKEMKFVDIGPSMINGEPNFSLAEFKKSIGCMVSNKFSFSKQL